MNDGQLFFQRAPLVEMPAAPSSTFASLPVHGVLCFRPISPGPSWIAPVALTTVTARLDELRELHIADLGPRDLERRDLHRVRPFLVIKYERLVRSGSKVEETARHFRIAHE